MNDTTRRHPRTLTEAFGPYTSSHGWVEPIRPMDWIDKVLIALSVIVCAGIPALMWLGLM